MKRLLYPIFLMCFFGCKKDNLTGSSAAREQLIADKKWKAAAITFQNADGTQGPDIFSSLPEYKKDDYWIFMPNGSYEINDNENLRPGVLTAFIDAGSWKFFQLKEYFQFTSVNPDITYPLMKIVTLTDQELKIQMEVEGKTQVMTLHPQ